MAATPTYTTAAQPPARYDYYQQYPAQPGPQASSSRPLPQVPQGASSQALPQPPSQAYPYVQAQAYGYGAQPPQNNVLPPTPAGYVVPPPVVAPPPPTIQVGAVVPPQASGTVALPTIPYYSAHQGYAPSAPLPPAPVQGARSYALPPIPVGVPGPSSQQAQIGSRPSLPATPSPVPPPQIQTTPAISVAQSATPSPAFAAVVAPPQISFDTEPATTNVPVIQEPSSPGAQAQAQPSAPAPSRQPQIPSSQLSAAEGSSCAACHKLIAGRVINAMSAFYHPACFKCAHCSESLEHVAFFEHEGKPYCHLDYHELFSTRCFHCRTPIVDERYITINDPDLVGGGGDGEASTAEGGNGSNSSGGVRNYHEMHFFCANCGDPFLDPNAAGSVAGANPGANLVIDDGGRVQHGGKAFVVHKGYPYCEGCHIRLHKPRCRRCKNPILTDEIINALGHKWHPDCFVCESCQQPFESSSVFVSKGKAYDEHCYKILLRQML